MADEKWYIDLNCDLGEGFPDDAELISLVSSVNIACGGHAGDASTMSHAVRVAKAAGANIGAHPGYEDRANFGRASVELSPHETGALMDRQLGRLADIAASEGIRLSHVKPHGMLYHVANRDPSIAAAVVGAVAAIDRRLALVGPAAGQLRLAADAAGLPYGPEGFADRAYLDDGTLVPRIAAGAVLPEPERAAEQAIQIVKTGQVTTITGRVIPLVAQTICVHGDGATAVSLLRYLRQKLVASGVGVARFRT